MMDCCCLSKDANRKENLLRSTQIDKQISKDKEKLKRTIKILLLGSGESGKSTLMKQMRIINGKEFLPEEIILYKLTVYENIVKGIKILVDACNKLQLNFSEHTSLYHADFVFNYDNSTKLTEEIFVQYKTSLKELWKDKGIQEAFERRKDFHLVGVSLILIFN